MSGRRAFVLVVVLIAVATCTLLLLGLQAASLRQAGEGREAVARLRARWAARAGLESTIARLGFAAQNTESSAPWSTLDDLADVAYGDVDGASWSIEHWNTAAGSMIASPEDAHAKININRMTQDDLLELPGATIDMADAILDWIDPDDLPNQFGAEEAQYAQAASPYKPRNAPLRSLFELDLVYGMDQELVRGEDRNLNGRLDPNEDDGDATWPPDNADGQLDAGWSAYVTAESVDLGLAASGQPRLYLADTSEEELSGRLPFLTSDQAEVILTHAQQDSATLYDFATTTLRQMAQQSNIQAPTLRDLEEEQVIELLNETTMYDPAEGPVPGRININWVADQTLDYLLSLDEEIRDTLLDERDDRQGFSSIIEFLEVLSPQQFAQAVQFFDVNSTSYVVTSVGRDERSGIEVEITATIERSALPIVITEYHVR
ncbi:MAG: general secretion pathway protein GspK [Phycisphaerales bacterium]|nr:general secretion pathway protein GspK [Phycisphaerales bacterium]